MCQIRDGEKQVPKIWSDFGEWAAYVVVERYEKCYCSSPEIHCRLLDKAARGAAVERLRYSFRRAVDSGNGNAEGQAEELPAYGAIA